MEINNMEINNNMTPNTPEVTEPVKRGRGRPKGSINKNSSYVRVSLAQLNELLGQGAKIQIPVKRDFIENLIGNGEDEEMEAISVQQPSVAKADDAPMMLMRNKSTDIDAGDDEEDEDTGFSFQVVNE